MTRNRFRGRVRVPSAADVQYFHMGLSRNASREEGNSQVALKWIQDKRIPAESRFRAHDTVWNKQDLIRDITIQRGFLCTELCFQRESERRAENISEQSLPEAQTQGTKCSTSGGGDGKCDRLGQQMLCFQCC